MPETTPISRRPNGISHQGYRQHQSNARVVYSYREADGYFASVLLIKTADKTKDSFFCPLLLLLLVSVASIVNLLQWYDWIDFFSPAALYRHKSIHHKQPFYIHTREKNRFKRHSTDKICEYNWICISIVVWLLCKYDIEWFLVSLISFLFLWWISFKIQAFLCTQSCHFSTTHFRSKMRMVLKPHICNTMSTETEHVKLHKGGSCCRTLLWNRIKFV